MIVKTITEPGIEYEGVTYPTYVFDSPPEGFRRAVTTNIMPGWTIIYKVLIGPDEGLYYSDIIRKSTIKTIIDRINAGHEVYVGALDPNMMAQASGI